MLQVGGGAFLFLQPDPLLGPGHSMDNLHQARHRTAAATTCAHTVFDRALTETCARDANRAEHVTSAPLCRVVLEALDSSRPGINVLQFVHLRRRSAGQTFSVTQM